MKLYIKPLLHVIFSSVDDEKKLSLNNYHVLLQRSSKISLGIQYSAFHRSDPYLMSTVWPKTCSHDMFRSCLCGLEVFVPPRLVSLWFQKTCLLLSGHSAKLWFTSKGKNCEETPPWNFNLLRKSDRSLVLLYRSTFSQVTRRSWSFCPLVYSETWRVSPWEKVTSFGQENLSRKNFSVAKVACPNTVALGEQRLSVKEKLVKFLINTGRKTRLKFII